MVILVVDDHAIIRVGLEYYIGKILPEVKVIPCETFPAALEALTKYEVNVVVLDIVMPGAGNTQMVSRIRKIRPDARILIYSGLEENLYALPYIKAGADGFLSKNDPYTEFGVAIKTVLDRGKYISRKIQQLMLFKFSDQGSSSMENPLQTLSRIEQEVLKLLIEGKRMKDIAAMLNLKQTTISTHKKNIFDKFGVTNVSELISNLQDFKYLLLI
ncbi:response regulator transcription factor [Larkinella terrae]|uniref:Response regulator n=1 Tax=Larkinella terrae TaxID=2025311 RepID=A0A7K0EQA0_9BACT|nr:response regulator transcription factor [Larkinella terrae]MRS64013.1 response regulator [Larkinella terrae]